MQSSEEKVLIKNRDRHFGVFDVSHHRLLV